MPTLAIIQNVTVDGSIEMLGDCFDPQGQADLDNKTCSKSCIARTAGQTVSSLARHTFEALRDYWPEQSDEPTGISDYLNRVEKYVVSSTMTDPSSRTPRSLGPPRRRTLGAHEAARPGHRANRQHRALPHVDRGRPRRPVPLLLRLSHRPQPRPSAVPGRFASPEPRLLKAQTLRSGSKYSGFARP